MERNKTAFGPEKQQKKSTPKPHLGSEKETVVDNTSTPDLINVAMEDIHNVDKKAHTCTCSPENGETKQIDKPGEVSDMTKNSFDDLNHKYIQVKLKLQWFEEWADLLANDNPDFEYQKCPIFPETHVDPVTDELRPIEAAFKKIRKRFDEHKMLWESVHQLYEKHRCTDKDFKSKLGTEVDDYFHHNTKIALLQISDMEHSLKDSLKRSNRKNDRKKMKSSYAKELHDAQIQKLRSENEELSRQLQEMKKVQTMENMDKQKVLREKEQLLLRLSEVAGDQLKDNNPEVTDLSDENRPIKLAEQFGELYDNEWTDAMEKLNATEISEEQAIEVLLNMLQEIYSVCQAVNVHQRQHLCQCFGLCTYSEEHLCGASFLHSYSSMEEKMLKGHMNSFMNSTAGLSLKLVKEIVLRPGKFRATFSDQIKLCENFVDKCITLCWYMNTKALPVVPVFGLEHGTKFSTNLFRNYTRSGDTTDFIVWPALQLHENGPILYRGVVQPTAVNKT